MFENSNYYVDYSLTISDAISSAGLPLKDCNHQSKFQRWRRPRHTFRIHSSLSRIQDKTVNQSRHIWTFTEYRPCKSVQWDGHSYEPHRQHIDGYRCICVHICCPKSRRSNSITFLCRSFDRNPIVSYSIHQRRQHIFQDRWLVWLCGCLDQMSWWLWIARFLKLNISKQKYY